MRITSAPSCAKVIPPSGAATNAEASTTRIPARIESIGIAVPIRSGVGATERSFEHALGGRVDAEIRVGIVTPAFFYVPYGAGVDKRWYAETGPDVEVLDLGAGCRGW